jgi:HK97 family phage portal protein
MGILERLGMKPKTSSHLLEVNAAGQSFNGLNDPAFYEYVRNGLVTGTVSASDALKNTAVLRSVSLISNVMGRLPAPIKLRRPDGTIIDDKTNALYRIFVHKPNAWQDANQFKKLMQLWMLLHGNAYAQVVRVGQRVVALNPIHPNKVVVSQNNDFTLKYRVTLPDGSYREYTSRDILHLRGDSEDGISGVSPVQLAADVINSRVEAAKAQNRVFSNGMMVGGNLAHPGKLSPEARANLIASMERRHSGSENAGKWIVTEEGMTAKPFASTAVDAQLAEFQALSVEDIGRVFGVPRPLLGVDDTSWGSGIEQLAILFTRFGLAPWFDVWEQAVKVTLIPERDWDDVMLDFDESELLRGTIKEQFEAYAKAAGSGGHHPWMEPNEIRMQFNLGPKDDGYGLTPAGQAKPSAQGATP